MCDKGKYERIITTVILVLLIWLMFSFNNFGKHYKGEPYGPAHKYWTPNNNNK